MTSAKPSLQRWLQLQCESASEVSAGVVVLAKTGDEAAEAVAEWPAASALAPSLTSAAKAAVKRDRMVVVAPAVTQVDAPHNRVISLPVHAGEATLGAIALAVRVADAAGLELLLKQLAQACDVLGNSWHNGQAQQSAAAPAAGTAEPGPQMASVPQAVHALHLQAVLLQHESLAEGGLAMVTELLHMLGCERVSLGVMQRTAMTLCAVSNSSGAQPQQDLLRLMGQAMQEAADQAAAVTYPALATDPARIVLAHAELQGRCGHVLLSLPLAHAGEVVGALLFECRGRQRLRPDQVALCEGVAASMGPLVALRLAAERTWAQRLRERAGALAARLGRRDDPWPKAAALLLVASLAAATLLPVPYRLAANVRVEGAEQRVLASPLDGYLRRSLARPGDTVRAGDLLVELADQDLLLEQRKWDSMLAQSENSFATALARGDRAQFIISQGKANEARARLELVKQQLARTRLVAPIDGVVIKGDLSQSLGAPVQRGDVLLTLAASAQYRLMVEVDERDIARVAKGMHGEMALQSMPGQALPIVIERVTPVALVRDGRNVFEVEARLVRGDAATLRPGLQGIVKLDAGERSAAWLWTHRGLDWLRLTWWSWWG
jgi:hypothetical protein